MSHHPSAQADGDPGVSKADVAAAICGLVAAAKLAGIELSTVLAVLVETWEVDVVIDPAGFQRAADAITS